MSKNKKEKLIYISLQEASKSCNYSQEYLSLRSRQGKLKSIKFGKNWVTTKEWLAEYVKKSEEYNNNHNGNGHSIKNIEEIKTSSPTPIFPVAGIVEVKKIKIIKVPKNLPTEKEPVLRFGFALAMIFILFLVGGLFSKISSPNNTLENISFLTQEISSNIDRTKINIKSEIVTADFQEKFQKYIRVLFDGIKINFANIKTRIFSLGDFFNKKSAIEKKEGMVVISSTEENEALKIKIQESFSDEVRVEQKDEGSGIITPVFKKGDGEQYLYIMVPIKN